MDLKLAKATASIEWQIVPVTNVSAFEALPPAAKDREIKKAADTFASTGRNVFVHYATPILSKRRELLLASGMTKKRYNKTAAQLWPTLLPEHSFFWNQAAKELRICMKQGLINARACIVNAGVIDERLNYLWYAEKAVADYLNLPEPVKEDTNDNDGPATGENEAIELKRLESTNVSFVNLTLADGNSDDLTPIAKELAVAERLAKSTAKVKMCEDATTLEPNSRLEATELLDTLPSPFEYEQNMLYSHFARYDFDEVRTAVGRTQTMLLRHLAERFEKTGKVLFYYYVVPRLCKQRHPPSKGDTVTGQAAEIWQFMLGKEKEKWLLASARLKKQLGDGHIAGLEMLELGSLDPEVLKLHSFAQAAIEGHEARRHH